MGRYRVIHRFLVASTNEGMRRSVVVHVYATANEMRDASVDGVDALATCEGLSFRFNQLKPAPATFTPVAVVRLSAENLTTRVIAHEMTHAAMHTYWTLGKAKSGSKLTAHMHAANELVAYLVGDWTADTIRLLQREGLEVTP